jgi:hypothetical protein
VPHTRSHYSADMRLLITLAVQHCGYPSAALANLPSSNGTNHTRGALHDGLALLLIALAPAAWRCSPSHRQVRQASKLHNSRRVSGGRERQRRRRPGTPAQAGRSYQARPQDQGAGDRRQARPVIPRREFLSANKAAAELNKRGIPTPKGRAMARSHSHAAAQAARHRVCGPYRCWCGPCW